MMSRVILDFGSPKKNIGLWGNVDKVARVVSVLIYVVSGYLKSLVSAKV